MDAEPVAVVSRELAREAFGDADPMGQRVNTGLDGREPDGGWRWVRIVGVVDDTRNRGPTRAPTPVLFRPLTQGGPGFSGDRLMAVLATDQEGGPSAARLRDAVGEVDPDAPVYGLGPATSLVMAYTGEHRLALLLLGVFSALAMALAARG